MIRILQDVRYAARKLLRAPGFSIFAIATLAIAIGATTSVFSIIDAVLLRPLPFRDPARLVFVESSRAGKPLPVSPTDWMDYRTQSHSFTDLAAVEGARSANLVRPGAGVPAVKVTEARVSATFFDVLGLRAPLGRLFAAGDDQRTAARVAVLSDAGWHNWFGGDPQVIGRVVRLDGDPYTIVGVAPPEAIYPAETDVFIPAVWLDYEIGDNARGSRFISAVGRLRAGATTESARRDLDAIARRIAVAFPRHDAKIDAWVTPLQQQIVGDTSPALWATFGAVAFVLLIACFNVANLLLVRAAGRFGEIAVRNALGASRGAVVRQLLTESIILSLAAAILGTLIASWIVSAVVAFGPHGLPRLGEIAVSPRVLAFSVIVSVVTALAFGLAPALHAARSDISQMLRDTGRGASRRTGDRMRSMLIVAEIALAVVLLTGFGLLLRSFDRLTHVNPGFNPEHLIAFNVALGGDRYRYEYQSLEYADRVMQRLAALPGSEAVAVTGTRPFDTDPSFSARTSFSVFGDPKPEPGLEPVAMVIPASPSFFGTAGLSLVRGRTYDETENRLGAVPVIVVNEALVRRYFGDRDPIGKRITLGLGHDPRSPKDTSIVLAGGEIVGVVKDVKQNSLSETAVPTAYLPYGTAALGSSFLVRTRGEPASVERAIRRELHDLDPDVPIYQLETMDDALSQSVAQPRFFTILLGAFAAIALLLAMTGVYGVIAYLASQRTREFGVRLALGATYGQVAKLVFARGVPLVAAGLVVGIAAAVVATRALGSMLYAVSPLDPVTFAAVVVALAIVAVLASLAPARKAARVDPLIAMRAE